MNSILSKITAYYSRRLYSTLGREQNNICHLNINEVFYFKDYEYNTLGNYNPQKATTLKGPRVHFKMPPQVIKMLVFVSSAIDNRT